MLLWIVQSEDADQEDHFELQANGTSLSKLEYLNLDFQLVDTEVPVFNGEIEINNNEVIDGSSEWRAATFKH